MRVWADEQAKEDGDVRVSCGEAKRGGIRDPNPAPAIPPKMRWPWGEKAHRPHVSQWAGNYIAACTVVFVLCVTCCLRERAEVAGPSARAFFLVEWYTRADGTAGAVFAGPVCQNGHGVW